MVISAAQEKLRPREREGTMALGILEVTILLGVAGVGLAIAAAWVSLRL